MLSEAVVLWYDPVGLYELEGDDLRILWQNAAATKNLGFDPTGMLLSEAFPSHRDPTGSSFGDDPDVSLLSLYLSVARTGVPWQGDMCYLADGVEGWYRTRVGRVREGTILITWADVSAEKVSIENQATFLRVQRGLLADEFTLHYQPIIALDTGMTAGFEALVRWPREDGSMRTPGEFLPAIHNTELINLLCWQVADLACKELERWDEEGIHQGCYLAINVSPFTVECEDFESRFNSILDHHKAPRSRVMVEVTEESAVEMALLPRLERLALSGVKIGIDDFGTGRTSLKTLHDMPYTTLIKIDQSFIKDILTNESSQKLVRTIVALAKELDMKVAAEGVESGGVAKWCLDAGVNYGQGWFWSKAVPVPAIASTPPLV